MITDNLYDKILIQPILQNNVNELFIISGYASATFLRRHMHELDKVKNDYKLNLIVGMPSRKNDHEAFLQLRQKYQDRFRGYYFIGATPVHSKVYSWYEHDNAISGFSGSANYSQYGFFSDKQINQMTEDNPTQIRGLFDNLLLNSISMEEALVEPHILERIPEVHGSIAPGMIEWIEPDKSVRISFLDRAGKLPGRSGLNWGQREEKRINPQTGDITWVPRNPDQAYLSIKGDARKKGFLPEKGFTFTLLTDDDTVMDCVVAQDNRKSVQTTNDNSELGRYLRMRLGLPFGSFVSVEDLENYGRTDFTLIKIDDETFLLDFSKPT